MTDAAGAFKVGAFDDSMDEASWHRVDPDYPGQSLCGEPSAQWPYIMRSALPVLGQPTCPVCDSLVGDVRPYVTADGTLINLPAGVEPFDVKPVLLPTYPKSAPGEGVAVGWSVPTDRIYDPINQETLMDHDNDGPTTDAETPELQAFQKRDTVALLIQGVIDDAIDGDELSTEQKLNITQNAAEMLLSNYFMRAVER